MKKPAQKSIICLICLLFCFTTGISAQQANAQIIIKTSAVCEICQKNIDKALKFKGIEKSNLDLKTQLLTVSFDPEQTSPEKINWPYPKPDTMLMISTPTPKLIKSWINAAKRKVRILKLRTPKLLIL